MGKMVAGVREHGVGAACGVYYPKESKTAVHGFAMCRATSFQLPWQHCRVEKARWHKNSAQCERHLTRCCVSTTRSRHGHDIQLHCSIPSPKSIPGSLSPGAFQWKRSSERNGCSSHTRAHTEYQSLITGKLGNEVSSPYLFFEIILMVFRCWN